MPNSLLDSKLSACHDDAKPGFCMGYTGEIWVARERYPGSKIACSSNFELCKRSLALDVASIAIHRLLRDVHDRIGASECSLSCDFKVESELVVQQQMDR
eukprot:239539-Amphidinium_carterae.4